MGLLGDNLSVGAQNGTYNAGTGGKTGGIGATIGTLAGGPVGGLIGGGIGALIQGWINRRSSKREFQNNWKMMEYQNEYNSPKMQMQRLKEAGLNPNLVYGSGNVVGNLTDTPEYREEPGQLNAQDWYTGLSIRQELKRTAAETDLIKANLRATQQETINKALMGERLGIDNALATIGLRIAGGTEKYQVDMKSQELEELKQRVKNAMKDYDIKDAEQGLKEVGKIEIQARIASTALDIKQKQILLEMLEDGIVPGQGFMLNTANAIAKRMGYSSWAEMIAGFSEGGTSTGVIITNDGIKKRPGQSTGAKNAPTTIKRDK